MIDRPALVAWRSKAPWPNPVQVEQDLLLSRLMIEIADDEILGSELVMRGGTCLHKLHLPTPLRYSEDLDYVRSTRTGIKPYTQALAGVADRVGLIVSSRQRSGQMVHVYLDGEPTEGIGRIRIKVEMNIAETQPFQPHTNLAHTVETAWWSGTADIPTFQPEEMLATKLRAQIAPKRPIWPIAAHSPNPQHHADSSLNTSPSRASRRQVVRRAVSGRATGPRPGEALKAVAPRLRGVSR
jgi:hypothetical protein